MRLSKALLFVSMLALICGADEAAAPAPAEKQPEGKSAKSVPPGPSHGEANGRARLLPSRGSRTGSGSAGASPSLEGSQAIPLPIPPASPGSVDVESLIKQLGDADFRKREEAVRRLKEIGPAALPALKLARESGDPEVASRSEVVIRHIERPRVPGRLPSGHPGSEITSNRLRSSVHNGSLRIEAEEEGGRVTRIDAGPNGIQMSVTGEEDGKRITRHFQARSPDELGQQNPEAYELFERFTGQGGMRGRRGGRFMPQFQRPGRRPGAQIVPIDPFPVDEMLYMRELVRRQLDGLDADADWIDGQRREIEGMLQELRRARRGPGADPRELHLDGRAGLDEPDTPVEKGGAGKAEQTRP